MESGIPDTLLEGLGFDESEAAVASASFHDDGDGFDTGHNDEITSLDSDPYSEPLDLSAIRSDKVFHGVTTPEHVRGIAVTSRVSPEHLRGVATSHVVSSPLYPGTKTAPRQRSNIGTYSSSNTNMMKGMKNNVDKMTSFCFLLFFF